ncbi:MAG: phospholipase D-like domain-containing protein [Methanosarcina vacuolata]|jgi:cardiolipin synthase|nr:phospholipase D-like domain-containing protein [Methanosarcina vacuolata]
MIEEIIPVATGEKWVGYGIRSFRSVINDLISNATNELYLTAYVLTDMSIVNKLKNALERGVQVEIYLYVDESSIRNETVDYILNLKREFNYLKIHRIENEILHAKVLVADGKKVLSGSANFTFSGMTNNYELGFLIEDPYTALQILKLIKKLGEK